MYSNQIHNSFKPAAWSVDKNTKQFGSNFTQKGSMQSNLFNQHVDPYSMGPQKTQYGMGFESTPVETISGELGGPIKGEDPLCAKIRNIIKEEMEKPEEEGPTLNLGITGLSYVFDRKQIIGCKIFWAVIIVSCISICSYQMVDRVSLFLGFPVAAEIGVVQNYTVKFPTLTVCAYDTTALNTLRKEYLTSIRGDNISNEDISNVPLYELVGFNGKTAEDIWKLTELQDPEYFIEWKFMDLLDEEAQVPLERKQIKLPLGTCTTFHLPKIVQYHGISTQIYFRSNISEYSGNRYAYSIMTHEPAEVVDMKSISPVTKGAKVGFTVLVKQYQAMSTPIDACVSTEENYKCHKKCERIQLLKNVTCLLPYMEREPEDEKILKPCQNKEEAKVANEKANTILLDLNATRDCNCVRKCLRVMYSMLPKSYKFSSSQTEVSIYYASNYFEIVQESYAYDWMSLLCDIGGNLGLYLGLSVLSIFEVVQSIFEMFKESLRPTHGPPPANMQHVRPMM